MEAKSGSSQKPLRPSPNAMKDFLDVYQKNPEKHSGLIENDGEKLNMTKENSDVKPMDDVNNIESAGEGAMTEADNLSALEAKISELEKERDDLRDKLLRTVAEMENFRRRTVREKQELLEYGNERLLLKMLQVLDDLGKAIESGKSNTDYEALLTGVEMIYQKTLKLFEESGVKMMESSVGKPFDVDFHDAIMHIPSELPEGHVVHETQAGYMYNGKVLRHAKVVTSAGEPDREQQ